MLEQKKTFKGTIVNLALPSLHGVVIEIMLTVPLKSYILDFISINKNR